MLFRQHPSSRAVPAVLKALGSRPFPERVTLSGGTYEMVCVFKHDFFAATGLFRRADGRQVVLKIGRMADILGWPARWLGRWLVQREGRIYQALAGVPNVPAFAGFWGENGFAHDYVPGHSLRHDERPGAEFIGALEALIAALHARDIAYVDLEKCANIIVGDDGRPHLIDFQIAWQLPGWWGRRFPPFVWFRRTLQDMDRYHLLKHRRRMCRDELTEQQYEVAHRTPAYIRLHRAMVKPLQKVRRAALKRLDPDRASEPG